MLADDAGLQDGPMCGPANLAHCTLFNLQQCKLICSMFTRLLVQTKYMQTQYLQTEYILQSALLLVSKAAAECGKGSC